MNTRSINGNDFAKMALAGAERLHQMAGQVNELNVFPVPDGDTGTNMNLTLSSGISELQKHPSERIGKAAEIFSKGLLMGARGNSGVILSQLFRGFAKASANLDKMDAPQFAAALQQGVDTAYQAVVKPVEGTILSVAKEAAKQAMHAAKQSANLAEVMSQTLRAAKAALDKTPDQLPVLRQVGVVDAGGQGLVFVYQGFLEVLSGQSDLSEEIHTLSGKLLSERDLKAEAHYATGAVQSRLSVHDIKYGYCTEFLLNIRPGKTAGVEFDEPDFRKEMEQYGDSLLVVADESLVKIHIHAEYPGNVMNAAMRYGDLTGIKIDNMRMQHSQLVEKDGAREMHRSEAGDTAEVEPLTTNGSQPDSEVCAVIAVAPGEGIANIFKSLGVDTVIAGGQTMNPSTEDFVKAIETLKGKTVIILPNNSNIILAAKQAAEVTDSRIRVIPTKTIPQGLAAALAFEADAGAYENERKMNRAAQQVVSGAVTFAVRDSELDGTKINKDDYIGLVDGKIVVSGKEIADVCCRVADRMLEKGGEIFTVLEGADALEIANLTLADYLSEKYTELEVEFHPGGQPLYAYLFSLE